MTVAANEEEYVGVDWCPRGNKNRSGNEIEHERTLFETKMKNHMDTAAGGNGIKSSKSLQGFKKRFEMVLS